MKKVIAAVAVGLIFVLSGCNDMSVEWDSEDVIDNNKFIETYNKCSHKQYTNPNLTTGKEFSGCLVYSYNMAKTK